MVNFKKIEYKRINYDKTKIRLDELEQQLKDAKDKTEFLRVFREINLIHLEIEQCADYADIDTI